VSSGSWGHISYYSSSKYNNINMPRVFVILGCLVEIVDILLVEIHYIQGIHSTYYEVVRLYSQMIKWYFISQQGT
jgi:hypothetical protein